VALGCFSCSPGFLMELTIKNGDRNAGQFRCRSTAIELTRFLTVRPSHSVLIAADRRQIRG
jgi:hypothetical protein